MDAKQIQIFSDSQLIVHLVNQDFTAKDASMITYHQHTRHLLATFDAHLISQVPRYEKSHADALARHMPQPLKLRSLAHKAIRQGYFWPSLHIDA
ncbi:hypothetical protein L3X38_042521 [Prunus dulcis]|uniref:RNase H type-1 domain-containing protein n=1 Tax=Prunus dulcis TaxID=3755 RepID=A0AAD4UWR6_PRUDU|nr:hypothetical protein L3X38_042521 [Prunus dulcis]